MFYSRAIIFFVVMMGCNIILGSSKLKVLNVVTVNSNLASIVKSIGADRVKVTPLVFGGRNLHDIYPKPSMVMKVRQADLLVRIGMGQDSWVDSLIQVAKNRRVYLDTIGHVDASYPIVKLGVPTGVVDGRHGDIHKEGNPHYYFDPHNGKQIANLIKNRLSTLDPDYKDLYMANYKAFVKRADDFIVIWERKLQLVSNAKFVTYHGVWDYFFNAFKLINVGKLEPFPGVPPTAKHIAFLDEELRGSSELVIVMVANFYPKHIGKSFSNRIGAKFVHLPTSVGDKDIDDYLDLLDYIVDQLTHD